MTGKLRFLRPHWPAPARVVALCTTRHGGCSENSYSDFNLADHVGDDPRHVAANRRLLGQELGVDLAFQWLDQVHGKAVADASRDGAMRTADAAVTTEAGLVCCVLTADCLPVFFASRDGAAVAVAHAGWRGLVAGVLENTLARFPAAASDTVAWLGPAIGPCHFEVGNEVRDAFLRAADSRDLNAIAGCFVDAGAPGKLFADLYRLATIRLARCGVGSVTGGGFCTYCDEARFYSYRRQSRTGRMASLIYLKP